MALMLFMGLGLELSARELPSSGRAPFTLFCRQVLKSIVELDWSYFRLGDRIHLYRIRKQVNNFHTSPYNSTGRKELFLKLLHEQYRLLKIIHSGGMNRPDLKLTVQEIEAALMPDEYVDEILERIKSVRELGDEYRLQYLVQELLRMRRPSHHHLNFLELLEIFRKFPFHSEEALQTLYFLMGEMRSYSDWVRNDLSLLKNEYLVSLRDSAREAFLFFVPGPFLSSEDKSVFLSGDSRWKFEEPLFRLLTNNSRKSDLLLRFYWTQRREYSYEEPDLGDVLIAQHQISFGEARVNQLPHFLNSKAIQALQKDRPNRLAGALKRSRQPSILKISSDEIEMLDQVIQARSIFKQTEFYLIFLEYFLDELVEDLRLASAKPERWLD